MDSRLAIGPISDQPVWFSVVRRWLHAICQLAAPRKGIRLLRFETSENIINWLEDLWGDIQFGLRRLRKVPRVLFIAVLTLGIGISANTVALSAQRELIRWRR